MKKLLSLILALTLILALAVPGLAANEKKTVEIAYRGIRIVVNGAAVTPTDANGSPVEPFILDGTTYLPVRAVAGALGLNVDWDAATSTVTLTSGGAASSGSGTPLATNGKKTVEIAYRDIKLVIDGRAITPTDANGSPVEPFILDGTTYLPVRAVAGALGAEVDWDAATSTVTLTTTVYLPSRVTTTISMLLGSLSVDSTSVASYTYDKAGNLLSLVTTSDGEEYRIDYTYDGQGRILSAVSKGSQGNFTQTYAYDAAGNMVLDSYSDSEFEMTSSYIYEGGLLLSSSYRTVDKTDGTVHTTDTSCTYDAAGRLLMESCTDSDGYSYTETYTYDAAGNMLSDSYTDSEGFYYATTYTYDTAGNLLSEVFSDFDGNGAMSSYTYDASGNTLSVAYSTTYGYYYNETYTYDAAGNLLSDTFTDSEGESRTTTNTYDTQGRLTGAVSVVDGVRTVTTVEYGVGGLPVRMETVSPEGKMVIEIEYIIL